jgi:hypothetical protein
LSRAPAGSAARAAREPLQLPPDLLDAGEGLGRQECGLHEELLDQVLRHLLVGNAADALVQRLERGLPREELERRLVAAVVQPLHQRLAEKSSPEKLSRRRVLGLARVRGRRQRRSGFGTSAFHAL